MVWKRLLGARADENIQVYVLGIQENAQILRSAGYTLNNELIAAVLLAGLPSEYGPFITSVTQSLRTNSVNVDALVLQILDEATRLGDSGMENGIRSMALASRGKGPTCWYCHESGHKEENCWKKYPDKKPIEHKSFMAISGVPRAY